MATGPTGGGDRALLRRLWSDWLRPHRMALALNLAVLAVFAGANALYPEVLRRSVDALRLGDTGALSLVVPAIIGATALKGAALYAHRVITNTVFATVEAEIQRSLFRHLVHADLDRIGREAPASLAARFSSDVGLVRMALERLATALLRDLLTVIGLFGALLWIDWELTLLALVGFPLIILPIAAIGRRLRKLARRSTETVSSMTAGIAESFGAVRVVKTYRLEDWLIARTDAAFETLRALKVKAGRSQSLIDPLLELLAGITVAGVIWVIGLRIAAGENTLGDITGFVAALLLAAQPLRALSNLNATVQVGLAGARRIVDAPGARPPAPGAGGEGAFPRRAPPRRDRLRPRRLRLW